MINQMPPIMFPCSISLADLPWIEICAVCIAGIMVFVYKIIDIRKEKIKTVNDFNRTIFTNTLEGLYSANKSQQISSAIMLRRFLNNQSKEGGKRLVYKQETINIIVSLLRIEKYGEFQKTLADSFSYVESMPEQDMQFTNLQNAYIKPNRNYVGQLIDMHKSDFYMADLSYASMNNLNLAEAVFFQSNLFRTVFRDCNLSNANFSKADLLGCSFKGNCILENANFSEAKNIPASILSHLDVNGFWHMEDRANHYKPVKRRKTVFISCLGNLSLQQTLFIDSLTKVLNEAGVDSFRYSRDNYRASGQIGLIRNEMAQCDGAIIVGFKSITVNIGLFRPNSSDEKELRNINISTPWSGIEAGIACALGLPVLVLSDDNLSDGIFDPELNDKSISRLVLTETSEKEIINWIKTIG